MDYGQPKQSNPVSQPTGDFFTTGAGTNQNSVNNFESENNLDLSSNGAAAWGQTPERDSRKIGSEAINSSLDMAANNLELQNEALGQMVKPEMPPGFPEITEMPNPSETDNTNSENIIDLSSIKGEKTISPKALEATEKAVEEFKKGKISPDELSNVKWEATKAYLKNSFGRELG